MLFEIAIVIVLTLVNGLLAMSELAIVSARSARLKVLADQGSRGAAIALDLAAEPGKFLSSVQIGITLVGVLSGAFSGATLGLRLTAALREAGLSETLSNALGVGGVVVAITYLSLILGELVPKQVALRSPESVAVRVAPLMRMIAKVGAPLVWLLDKSGKLVLKALGQSGEAERTMTDEEIRMMISEAESAGVMEEAETRMIEGVMRVADRVARGLMTPRHAVETVDISDSPERLIQRFRETGHSRMVVRDGIADDAILGVITLRDLLDLAPGGDDFDLRRDLIPAPVVPDSLPALSVIEELRKTPARMVFVYDEYGDFLGIITAMDVVEGITGDFAEDEHPEPKVVTREDGSLLVSGWMPADEFAALTGIPLAGSRDYATVAGFVLDLMGVLPAVGAVTETAGWRIEVLDLDGRRIDKLLVSRL